MSEEFAKGLRNLPIVCNYPELWMAITLNGFGSYLKDEALKVFDEHKIMIVKEKGDSSQVCQLYTKDITKEDTHHHHSFLNGISIERPIVDE